MYYRKSVLHLFKRMFHVRLRDAVQICGKFWDTQTQLTTDFWSYADLIDYDSSDRGYIELQVLEKH